MRKNSPKKINTFMWITEEWLIILISILLLLAIAIGAAGARTLLPSPAGSKSAKTSIQQPLATSFGEDPLE